MNISPTPSEKLPTIIDNQAPNTALEALKRILPEAQSLDIATGYFEIGSLLALDSFWNQLKKIRLLMGDETTKRTRQELIAALRRARDESIESEKEKGDSLTGLAAIRQALDETRIIVIAIVKIMRYNSLKKTHYERNRFNKSTNR